MSTFQKDVADFLAATGMPKSQLGLGALNDKAFVSQLENGRRVWPETEAKVRAFMAAHSASADDKAAAVELTLGVNSTEFSASLSSLAEVAQAFLEAGGSVIDLPLGLVDPAKLDDGRFLASRADDGRLILEPGDGFRDLVTAVRALKIDGYVINVEDRHGWPILSVAVGTSTVTEDRGAGNGSPAEGVMDRVVTCSVCDKRLDDRTVRACQWQDCPQAERWAA